MLALTGAGVWYFAIRDESDALLPEQATPFELHGWAPYWTLQHSTPQLDLRAEYFSQLSPFWFQATGVETIEQDPNAPERATDAFISSARRQGIPIVPSIIDALDPGGMANILANDDQRRRHVGAIVAFAEDGEYDGIDIDYEQFAFADGRDTWDATRPDWVRFIDELSSELHDIDKTLTVSIPPVFDDGRTDDSGFWVYDYAAITPMVDRIRVMAYDYSTSEPGPISPIKWVQRAAAGTAEVSGDPSKLILGLPLYGYNWVSDVQGTCPEDDPSSGRTTVNLRTLPALLDKRRVEPQFNERTGESRFTYRLRLGEGDTTCTQTRRVHFVDADGAQLRLEVAKEAGFGGVSLWAFGFENGSVWNRVVPALATGSSD